MNKLISLLFLILAISACTPDHQHDKGTTPAPNNKLEGCQWQLMSIDACVQIAWEVGPAVSKTRSQMLFRLVGPVNKKTPMIPVDLAVNPHVEIFMPDMGHGSDEITVEKLEVGLYRATNINFSMVGYWEMRIQLREKDKVADEAIVAIELK